MKKKYSIKSNLNWLVFIFLFVFNLQTYSQTGCAGLDNTIDICDKESDTAFQTYDLFTQLNGNPVAGGVWFSNSPVNETALDNANGILNLWQINIFGEHSFTYTNDACGESAVVTINLGGYPGEDNVLGGANACEDEIDVNLFSFLDNESLDLVADINGTWEGDAAANPHLNGSSFNARAAGVGTYDFTYTVASNDTCPENFATVTLEVHRLPVSGIGSTFTICTTDDFSSYRDFNLFDQLIGEDTNGIWSEGITSEISNALDSTIDLEAINNNFGPGTYTFNYTVFPLQGVCDEQESVVIIDILDISDVEFDVIDYCDAGVLNISVNINADTSFSFDLDYEIRNTNTNELIHSDSGYNIITISGSDTNIILDPSPITEPGNYTISAINISNLNGFICDSFEIASTSFNVYSPDLSITESCFDETTTALIPLTNFTDGTGNLINNTESISYTLSYTAEYVDPSNFTTDVFTQNVTVEDADIAITNGAGEIPVDFTLFDFSSLEDFIVTSATMNLNFINNSSTPALNCVNETFPVGFIPEDISLSLSVDNICDATEMQVLIDAPTLFGGEYTINYTVNEAGSTDEIVANELIITGGEATFEVDIESLQEGNYEVKVHSIQDDTKPCRTQFEFDLLENFSIGGVPDAPILADTQSFCFSDFAPDGPTIADIMVDTGTNLTWYEDNTSTTPLALTEFLIDGEDYYVSEQDCNESIRSIVTVNVSETSIVLSTDTTPEFCEADAASLADLNATTQNNGDLVWFDASTDGNELPATTSLTNGISYFALERSGVCEGPRLEFVPTINATPITVLSNEICATPGDAISSLETYVTTEAGFELRWYDSSNVLITDTSVALIQNTTYLVTSYNPVTMCESATNPILVSITSLISSNNINPIFCIDDAATVDSLDAIAENNGDIIWYDALTGGNVIDTTTVLTTGNYYASETMNDCEGDRLEFTVTIVDPETPVYNGSIPVCVNEDSTLLSLENNITFDTTFNLIWYDAATGGNELANTTILTQGTNYYAATSSTSSTCESERLEILVNVISTATTDDENPIFCGIENPTLADINVTSPNDGTLIWYDSITGGNVLPDTTILSDATSYYVEEENLECGSIDRLQVNVTIIATPTPIFSGETSLCALENPTLLNLEEDEDVTRYFNHNTSLYELIWYETSDRLTELSSSEELTEGATYYAVLRDLTTTCEGEALALTISLTNCDIADYDFFIPDGFSPNNDGTNDTYYVPNIEFFYPDYEIEIFNRYGQSLFKGDINSPEWDGSNNGSNSDTTSGVYFYILNYNQDDLKPKQGRLYLSK